MVGNNDIPSYFAEENVEKVKLQILKQKYVCCICITNNTILFQDNN